ncbi:hypothetical protein ACIBU0_35795 [Streptomyces sp. NPDC049627]|uniref:hypothetical protein n=1 Tax=Streptomyces sp. NPDC049627 TaxID=3365595 RepID=UPI00378A073A
MRGSWCRLCPGGAEESQQIRSPAGIWRIDELVADAPDDAWQVLSCGDGAKSPRTYDWAVARLPVNIVFDPDHPRTVGWVMARRSLARPDELAHCLAYSPEGTTIEQLVRIAGTRWAIEACFPAAKGGCGMDHYEVRRNPGWYPHITSVMLAHAFLAAMTADGGRKGGGRNDTAGLAPLTVAEIGACWKLSALARAPSRRCTELVPLAQTSPGPFARACHYRRRNRG